MSGTSIASLKQQIQELLANMNLPADASATIMEGMAQLVREAPCQGLPMGTMAPDFILRNQDGAEVSLQESRQSGPVVLKFIRGSWCPFCNLDVAALKTIVPQLTELRATVLVINPQRPDRGLELQSKHQFEFDVLSDEQQHVLRSYALQFSVPEKVREVYKKFGFNLPEHTADGSWNLPVPATYIIDRDGFIRARHFDLDYLNRMEPLAILDSVQYLTTTQANGHSASCSSCADH